MHETLLQQQIQNNSFNNYHGFIFLFDVAFDIKDSKGTAISFFPIPSSLLIRESAIVNFLLHLGDLLLFVPYYINSLSINCIYLESLNWAVQNKININFVIITL